MEINKGKSLGNPEDFPWETLARESSGKTEGEMGFPRETVGGPIVGSPFTRAGIAGQKLVGSWGSPTFAPQAARGEAEYCTLKPRRPYQMILLKCCPFVILVLR